MKPCEQLAADLPEHQAYVDISAWRLADRESMGALLDKVVELGNTYRECGAAALAGAK